MHSFLTRIYERLTGDPFPGSPDSVGRAAVGAFAVGVLAFGFELTNPTLGVDDYQFLATEHAWIDWVAARGMWGSIVVQALIPSSWITPFVGVLLGIGIQVISGILAGWYIGFPCRRALPLFVFYTTWATFPYFAAQMAFSYLQIGYPLASLLVVLGLGLGAGGREMRAARVVGSALLIGFGISVYPGCMSLIGPLILLKIARELLDSSESRAAFSEIGRVLARAGAGLVLAALFYYVAHQLVLSIFSLEPLKSHYYQVSFDPAFWERWAAILRDTEFLLLGAGDVIPIASFGFLAVSLGVGGVFLGLSNRNVFRPPAAILLGGLAALSVFSVLLIKAAALAPRSSVGLGLVWAAALAAPLLVTNGWPKRIACICAGVVIVQFVFHVNAMFYSQHLTQVADQLMISRIVERVEGLYAGASNETQKQIVPIGNYSHPHHAHRRRFVGSSFGFSNFEWDFGNRWRMKALALAVGADGYTWGEVGGNRSSLGLETRQPWPGAESVFLQDGRVYLWLGEAEPMSYVAPLSTWLR